MLLQLFHENKEGRKEADPASSSFSLCFWNGAIQGMASPALSSSPESWGCTGGGTGGAQAAVSSSREPEENSSHWRWLGGRFLRLWGWFGTPGVAHVPPWALLAMERSSEPSPFPLRSMSTRAGGAGLMRSLRLMLAPMEWRSWPVPLKLSLLRADHGDVTQLLACGPAPGELGSCIHRSFASSAEVCSVEFPPQLLQGLVWGPGGFSIFFSCQWLSNREREVLVRVWWQLSVSAGHGGSSMTGRATLEGQVTRNCDSSTKASSLSTAQDW